MHKKRKKNRVKTLLTVNRIKNQFCKNSETIQTPRINRNSCAIKTELAIHQNFERRKRKI